MKNVKGIIFDYGGTLDTNGVHWFHIFRRVYARHLPQVAEAQLREAYVYAERYLATHRVIVPTDDFAAMLRKKVDIQVCKLKETNALQDVDVDLMANECDAHVRINMQQTRMVLDTLYPRYPMVLVSNFYGNIHSVLRTYDIEKYFKAIVESAVVGIRKPDPQIFSLGVEALGMNADEVLVVGDSYGKDIAPAHSIGCRTVWIEGQGWDNENDSKETSSSDAVITTLTQLLNIV